MNTSSLPDRHCHRTTLALPWLLNGSLEAEERREVREHLIVCARCREELARTRQALAMVQGARVQTAREATPVTPPAVLAPVVRFPLRPAVRRTLVAAAAVTAVVLSLGGLRVALRPEPRPAAAASATRTPQATAPRADSAAAAEPAATTPSSTSAVTEPAPAIVATVDAPGTSHAATPAHPARRGSSRAAATTPAPRAARAIFATSFEGSSIAAMGTHRAPHALQSAAPTTISTVGFEDGLGPWHGDSSLNR